MPCIVNSNIFYTVAFALIGAKVLASLYFHIKTFWPEAYTSVDSAIDEHVRENPIRSYLFFRAAPVFVVTLFVMVLIDLQYFWCTTCGQLLRKRYEILYMNLEHQPGLL